MDEAIYVPDIFVPQARLDKVREVLGVERTEIDDEELAIIVVDDLINHHLYPDGVDLAWVKAAIETREE